MARKPSITISDEDYKALHRLIESVPESSTTDQLIDELERAKIKKAAKMPPNVVGMHSEATFTVLSTGKTFTYTLVYPNELEDSKNTLSVLSPVGSAIIGLTEGQEIEWPIGQGKKSIVRVEQVRPKTPVTEGAPPK